MGMRSRSERKAENNLGIVATTGKKQHKFRSEMLDTYDAYFEGRQYDHLTDWEKAHCQDDYVPVRKRKPRVIINYVKRIANTFSSKLLSSEQFPKFSIDGPPDDEATILDNLFLNAVVEAIPFEKVGPELGRRMALSGSCLLRYFITENASPVFEVYRANHCYPVLDKEGNIEEVRIQYTYKDQDDIDPSTKSPKEKWFRLELGKARDILYDNPEYKSDATPNFEPVDVVEHGLGFIQAEWFRTTESAVEIDGDSLIGKDTLSMIDAQNYSLSQSDQAISYGQEPQLTFRGMLESELEHLAKTSEKAWNLGREGEASFLEPNLNGPVVAREQRDRIRLALQDVTRVILHDPDRMNGVQSGKALEILNQPLVDLITEVRPLVAARLKSLVIKFMYTLLILKDRGQPIPINIPDGYAPSSLKIEVKWPKVFKPTMADLRDKIGIAATATNANIVSRETAIRWVAKDFDIEDVALEMERIATQPRFNTFGF